MTWSLMANDIELSLSTEYWRNVGLAMGGFEFTRGPTKSYPPIGAPKPKPTELDTPPPIDVDVSRNFAMPAPAIKPGNGFECPALAQEPGTTPMLPHQL